jgi:hypothetical protein
MNRALELHDSEINSISVQGDEITIEFRVVYTHQSLGEPGVAEGTGWYERATLVLTEPSIDEPSSLEFPSLIYDGWAEINGSRHRNVFPLPLERNAKLTLRCETYHGPLEVSGIVESFVLHGRVGEIEQFKA